MNYANNEVLRQDIAQLSNSMKALELQLKKLERKYRWNSDDLSQALAGQLLRQAVSQYQNVYKQIWELDLIFFECPLG